MMRDNWDLYDKWIKADGDTFEDRLITQWKRDHLYESQGSGALKTVTINDEERKVLIISGSSEHQKRVCSMPDEEFFEGDYMIWENRYWLISDVDRENDVYYRGIARECNRQLRWQNANGEIVTRWCASDEKASNTQGISYLVIIDKVKTIFTLFLPLDDETIKLRRHQRFIMDIDLEDPDTYIITNRNVITSVYDPEQKHGVIMIVVSQDERSQDHDNLDLQVADYKEPVEPVIGTKCEIKFKDNSNIKAGGSYKEFTAVFFDDAGNEVNLTPVWNLTFVPDTDNYYEYYEDGNSLFIKAANEPSILRQQVRVQLTAEGTECECVLYAKVVYVI